MEILKILGLLLLISCQVWAVPNPDAEAEADAEAVAEADAQADAQADPDAQGNYMMPMPGYGFPTASPLSLMPNYPGGGGGQDSCSINNQCCDFDQKGCCFGKNQDQRSYTKWVQKCGPGYGECKTTNFVTKCFPFQERYCRNQTDFQDVKVPDVSCKPIQDTVCANYTQKYCEWEYPEYPITINYTDQSLTRIDITEQPCVNVSQCRMEDRWFNYTVTEEKIVCDNITTWRKICKPVPRPGPPKAVNQPMTQVLKRTVCFERPALECVNVPCNQPCSPGLIPCDQSYETRRNCPISGLPDECGSPDYCGTCKEEQVPKCITPTYCQTTKRCCRTKLTLFFQDEFFKMQRNTVKYIPGSLVYDQECESVPTVTPSCRKIRVPVNKPYKKKICIDGWKQHCFNVTIPKYDLHSDLKEGELRPRGRACRVAFKDHQFCKTVDVDVKCTPVTIKKKAIVMYQVCDQYRPDQRCFKVPESKCVGCSWIPIPVLVPDCPPPTKSCETCADWYSLNGYPTWRIISPWSPSGNPSLSCPNGQCNNFYTPSISGPQG